jgi:antibiotic biosynthesis monooxygenase (ABM) superfamily enzyme
VTGVVYCVRSWVDPENGSPYLKWLEHKHMAEVRALPGVTSARRVRLEQTDAKGWAGYLLLYEFVDRATLKAYFASADRQRFWRELDAFKDIHYSERFWGDVDWP